MRRFYISLILLTAFSVLGNEPMYPLLPADISSPRATLNSFVGNCEIAYELLKENGRDSADSQSRMEIREAIRNIKHCMDLSEIADFRRDNSAKEAAVALKEVLDRIELPKEKNIPDLNAMTHEDGSLIERWTIPNTEITFDLITDGPLEGSYKFSPSTVNRAGEFLQRVEHLPYKEGSTEGFAASYLTSPSSQ